MLAAFACPLLAVRLMRLTPGSVIKEHHDHDLSFEQGTVRIHVPVATNDAVDFRLNGTRCVDAGRFRLVSAPVRPPFGVANRGTTDRVHMVIDAGRQWLGADPVRRARSEPPAARRLDLQVRRRPDLGHRGPEKGPEPIGLSGAFLLQPRDSKVRFQRRLRPQFPSGHNEGAKVQVLVRDNNVDQALKALKKKMQREGIFREMKLRGHYEKPSEKRRAKRPKRSAAPASSRARRCSAKACCR